MHHAALDRPGPHDRDLDHQVVIAARPQPRQHAHLRAALDLEGADGVGTADHLVGGCIVARDVLHREAAVELVADEFERAPQRTEHAEREHVDLDQAQFVEIVLVPLDHAAALHRGHLDRHQLLDLIAGDDESARVLAQMPREVDQLLRQRDPHPRQRRVGVEAGFAQARGVDVSSIEPVQALRQQLDALQIDAQRAAHIPQRRPRPIADHHGRQRGAVPTVFAIDVPDDFFAPLVLEIDIDVGRLMALGADETLEQQLAFFGVHLGDAQAVTDHRIGRAAAPLAQDLLLARPVHDVGHGQEISLVAELLDQRELFLDLRHPAHRHRARTAPGQPFMRQVAQVADRRQPFGHDLARVLVLQLVQREAAAPCQHQRVVEPLALVQCAQPRTRTQVLLGIRPEPQPACRHRPLQPRRTQHVLQGLARAQVHQHIAARDDGQPGELSDAAHDLQQFVIPGPAQQRDRDRRPILKPGLQPHRVREHGLERLRRVGHEQREALGQAGERGRVRHLAFDVAGVREVSTFRRAAPRDRDPVREVAVAAAGLRQQHEAGVGRRAVLFLRPRIARQREPHLAADDQVQTCLARRHMRAHHAGKRAFVGDRQRRIAQRLRAFDQLGRVRRAGQEAEVAAAVQLGIAGEREHELAATAPISAPMPARQGAPAPVAPCHPRCHRGASAAHRAAPRARHRAGCAPHRRRA